MCEQYTSVKTIRYSVMGRCFLSYKDASTRATNNLPVNYPVNFLDKTLGILFQRFLFPAPYSLHYFAPHVVLKCTKYDKSCPQTIFEESKKLITPRSFELHCY